MNKAKITFSLAIMITLGLAGSALAATATLSPSTTIIPTTITSPTFTLTSDPVITTTPTTPPPTNGTTTDTTTTDPATTTPTTTNTNTSSTTPTPGTFDPAVLRGPSSGTTTEQPVDQTPVTSTETTATTVTPTRPTTTPTRPVIPPRNTTIPSTQPESPVTPECPAPTPANPAPICPVAVDKPIIPTAPWQLIWTPILGVLLFGSIIYFFQNSSFRTEQKLEKLHSKNQTQQIIEKNRNKSYREFLDYINLELTSQSNHNQAVLDHLNAKINLLGSPEIQTLSNQISSAINQGNKSEAKNLLRQFALQIKKEF